MKYEDLVWKLITIQKENLYILQQAKQTGEIPETHLEYMEYLEKAVESLTNLGYLNIEEVEGD